MESFETFEHAGMICELHYDEDPTSPDDWDNLGTFTHWARYTFGEPIEGSAKSALERGGIRMLVRYLELVEHAAAVVPVGLLDHSGLHLYAEGGPHWSDSAGWDSGTVGVMWTTHKRVSELCGEGAEYHTQEWIEDALRAEIKTWDDYVSGAVVGFVVRDPSDAVVDSCWGFYPNESTREDVHGLEYVRAEAREAAEYEQTERERAARQDIATVEA